MPLAYGWYFTVWQKQGDGSWKAVADIGTTTPAHGLPGTDAFHAAAPGDRPPAIATSGPADAEAIQAAEKTFSTLASVNALEGYLAIAADGLRLHRDGGEPVVGVAAVKAFLAGKPARIESTPMKTGVSRSGDLGYAYGSYLTHAQGSSTPPEERGFYLRVWKRLGGRWRLVADITNAVPPAAPPR
jgi:ketosteroid isomerase-like protein